MLIDEMPLHIAIIREITGQSPFLTKKGYKPRTSFDWDTPIEAYMPKEKLNRTKAKALVNRLHKSWSII
jgi:hypothetical protein